MFERFIRLMLSADVGDGGGGSVGATVSTGGPTDDAAAPAGDMGGGAAPAAPAAPQAPPQQQGPNWDSLGVPFDQAQQRLKYFEDLNKRYESDPTWAQKFDQLYGGQQQQQPHPYDWMTDEKAMAERRQLGEQHPDHQRLTAEFTNFFHNQPGHLAQLANHPKVAEASFQAQAPMIQDLVGRMIQQATGPLNQFMDQMGEQQFRNTYAKPFAALPQHIRDMWQEGIFGDPNTERQKAVIGAVKAAQKFAASQQQPVPGQEPAKAPSKTPPTENANKSKTHTPSNSKDEDAYAEELTKAQTGKKR
jgi:hypothetical protein